MARSFTTTALSLGLAGALALAAATPSFARDGRRAATAAGVGFAAGALVGAAAATAASPFYGAAYGYDGYAGDYAYAPGYDAYAAAPSGYAYRNYYAAPQYDSAGVAIDASPYCPIGAAQQNRC
jgi:hypothetical protein